MVLISSESFSRNDKTYVTISIEQTDEERKSIQTPHVILMIECTKNHHLRAYVEKLKEMDARVSIINSEQTYVELGEVTDDTMSAVDRACLEWKYRVDPVDITDHYTTLRAYENAHIVCVSDLEPNIIGYRSMSPTRFSSITCIPTGMFETHYSNRDNDMWVRVLCESLRHVRRSIPVDVYVTKEHDRRVYVPYRGVCYEIFEVHKETSKPKLVVKSGKRKIYTKKIDEIHTEEPSDESEDSYVCREVEQQCSIIHSVRSVGARYDNAVMGMTQDAKIRDKERAARLRRMLTDTKKMIRSGAIQYYTLACREFLFMVYKDIYKDMVDLNAVRAGSEIRLKRAGLEAYLETFAPSAKRRKTEPTARSEPEEPTQEDVEDKEE